MYKYSFYPFKNHLDDLCEEDLLLLKDVSEGWYIDYKSETIKVIDFSKQLSAFANQYGGWLIIGITENARRPSLFNGVKWRKY